MRFTFKKRWLLGVVFLGSLLFAGTASASSFDWHVSQPCYMHVCTGTLTYHPDDGQAYRLDIDYDHPNETNPPSNTPRVTQICQGDGSPSCTYTTPVYQTGGYRQLVVWLTSPDTSQDWHTETALVADPRDRPGQIRFVSPHRVTRSGLVHLVSDKPVLEVAWSKGQGGHTGDGVLVKVREWRDSQGKYQWLGRFEKINYQMDNHIPGPVPYGTLRLEVYATLGHTYDKVKDYLRTYVTVVRPRHH